jgi:hypothetical protein
MRRGRDGGHPCVVCWEMSGGMKKAASPRCAPGGMTATQRVRGHVSSARGLGKHRQACREHHQVFTKLREPGTVTSVRAARRSGKRFFSEGFKIDPRGAYSGGDSSSHLMDLPDRGGAGRIRAACGAAVVAPSFWVADTAVSKEQGMAALPSGLLHPLATGKG